MNEPSDQVWFQNDDAWDFLTDAARAGLTPVDVREEARGLRFITSAEKIEAFAVRHAAQFRPYTLFGSGDFHHLSAIWTRQFTESFHILSFDNHPDWDIRPPRWSCGAWVNRALENPRVQTVNVWGCGNFECNFPARLLGNRGAALEARLLVQPWAQKGRAYPAWLRPITPETWKSQFIGWLETVPNQRIYVTIDLDCLAAGEVCTNWENGRFAGDDLVWALSALREKARIIGGDLCGAWSEPHYQTGFQRLAGWFDHPRVPLSTIEERESRHLEVWQKLWPALTGKIL
jgi:arginase family enzyme